MITNIYSFNDINHISTPKSVPCQCQFDMLPDFNFCPNLTNGEYGLNAIANGSIQSSD